MRIQLLYVDAFLFVDYYAKTPVNILRQAFWHNFIVMKVHETKFHLFDVSAWPISMQYTVFVQSITMGLWWRRIQLLWCNAFVTLTVTVSYLEPFLRKQAFGVKYGHQWFCQHTLKPEIWAAAPLNPLKYQRGFRFRIIENWNLCRNFLSNDWLQPCTKWPFLFSEVFKQCSLYYRGHPRNISVFIPEFSRGDFRWRYF